MTNPFKFRPTSDEAQEEVLSWEDNWASNFMAWFSQVFLRSWCDDENHWTFRVVNYLWADCACCLSWRFFCMGLLVGLAVGLTVAAIW